MKIKSLIAGTLLAAGLGAGAVNPILPLWECIPDGEPYVFEDPDKPGEYRVYLYGSHDSRITEYCGLEQVVWSAPVDNLNDWRYDGIIFISKTDPNGDLLNEHGEGDVLFAPDVALRVDPDGSKTYYLYPNIQNGGRQGAVAKSSRPDGPFAICNWSPDNPKETTGAFRFDPAAFVDDDGRAYVYWGFERSYAAEVDPADMQTVKGEIVEDMIPGRFQEGQERFFEASSIRKIKDKYVFVYSRFTIPGEDGMDGESNYTLAYAYGDNPLGPFTYGGTIIDGRALETLPDGTVFASAAPNGNTHGGICEIGGKWWVFYHRQNGTNEYCRQAMVAPVDVMVEEGPGGKVVISQAEYTSEGFDTEGLAMSGIYPAGIACHFTGPEPATALYPNRMYTGSYVKASYFGGDPAKAPSDIELKSCPVVNNTDGSIVGYKYFNFDTAPADEMDLVLDIKPLGIDGAITVVAGKPFIPGDSTVLGTLEISKDDPQSDAKRSVRLRGLASQHGKRPLYLLFSSPVKEQSICTLYSLDFVAL